MFPHFSTMCPSYHTHATSYHHTCQPRHRLCHLELSPCRFHDFHALHKRPGCTAKDSLTVQCARISAPHPSYHWAQGHCRQCLKWAMDLWGHMCHRTQGHRRSSGRDKWPDPSNGHLHLFVRLSVEFQSCLTLVQGECLPSMSNATSSLT